MKATNTKIKNTGKNRKGKHNITSRSKSRSKIGVIDTVQERESIVGVVKTLSKRRSIVLRTVSISPTFKTKADEELFEKCAKANMSTVSRLSW